MKKLNKIMTSSLVAAGLLGVLGANVDTVSADAQETTDVEFRVEAGDVLFNSTPGTVAFGTGTLSDTGFNATVTEDINLEVSDLSLADNGWHLNAYLTETPEFEGAELTFTGPLGEATISEGNEGLDAIAVGDARGATPVSFASPALYIPLTGIANATTEEEVTETITLNWDLVSGPATPVTPEID